MQGKQQVRYFRGSPAAELAEVLRGHYDVSVLTEPEESGIPRSTPPAASAELDANEAPAVWLVDLANDRTPDLGDTAQEDSNIRLIGVVDPEESTQQIEKDSSGDTQVFAYLPRQAPHLLIEKVIAAAFANIELAARERAAREELERAEREMEQLNLIGAALSAQHNVAELLNMILQKGREITGADAGSLYLIEEGGDEGRRLRFKLTQNDSRQFPFREFDFPLTEDSMAGYVALHGEALNLPDAYILPSDQPYRFNSKYDQTSGYRTRSVLTLPMKNPKGEVLGVLQLINSKRNPAARLETLEDVNREVQPFPERWARLAQSLASQAAVAYENNKLYDSIESLFEGFVKAAVTAIEQRDPTTSGHSLRVSSLTEGLAETVDQIRTGPYAAAHFTREQMREIRYAALLHDFGKVGVREEVLIKAKKLYPFQIEILRQRFEYIRMELDARTSRRKFEALLQRSREEALAHIGQIDAEYHRALQEVDEYFQFILQVNEPTVLPEGKFDLLLQIAQKNYFDSSGKPQPYLSPEEVGHLSIPKGSLDPQEREQIESHVIHTVNFLNQIPWTKELKQVPSIARAHHETLIGTGYPYKLKGDEIPLPAKIMTICDIYDALSASDRPYKRAVPVDRALTILEAAVRKNELDAELFRLFVDAKIYTHSNKSS
jgi:HD-GYP domain-containing protein (c-di-GMP phosphodiesterase class II)